MTVKQRFVLAAWATLSLAAPLRAGLYTDELAKCLVESTSSADKVAFSRWVFVAIAAHPAVADLSAVTPASREASNRQIGALITRLLVEDCRSQAERALRYERTTAMEASFSVLGQVAMQELMTNPAVGAVLEGLEEHVDSERLEELGKAAKPGEKP